MSDNDKNFVLLQNMSNNILELSQRMASVETIIKGFEKKIDDYDGSIRQLSSMIRDRMTPDRCAHMHDEMKREINDKISKYKIDAVDTVRKDVRSWMQTAWVVLKVIAVASVIFGGSTLGAQALGLIKVFN